MARVEVKSQANGVVLDSNGNAVVNASIAIKNLDGTAATHYSAKTGGTSSTANVVTGADGTIPRFVETGSYNIQVTPPGGSVTTFPLEAVNADQVVGASAASWQGVQEEGANLTTRGRINFIGAGVTAADDSANGRTNVTIPGGGGGGTGHTIQDEGSALATRTGLNFTGAGVTATDDVGNNRTNVTIPGTTGHTIQDEGSALTARTGLNFIGANVTAADDAANNRTNVTISGGSTGGHTIQDEGSNRTARTNLNFVGTGVTVSDSSGTDSTVVTIPGAAGGAGSTIMAAQDPSGDWWTFDVDSDGILVTENIGATPPTGGDIVISTVPMTQSPDGNWWVQTTDNTGRLTTSNVGAVPTTGTPPFASLADLTLRVPKHAAVIEPTNTTSRALEVFSTNPISGRKERFSIENNQDTWETDVNFRNTTVNFGDNSAAVSVAVSAIFLQPASPGTQNPIIVKEAGQGTAGANAFFVGPHGTINAHTYGFATFAFQVGAFNEAQMRLTITSDGQIERGPGGSTAPDCGIYFGTGTPEGAVTAGVGSLYQRRDGGAGTSLYVKQTGTGNTGWVGK
jgi:hypothetical protein